MQSESRRTDARSAIFEPKVGSSHGVAVLRKRDKMAVLRSIGDRRMYLSHHGVGPVIGGFAAWHANARQPNRFSIELFAFGQVGAINRVKVVSKANDKFAGRTDDIRV